MACQSVVLPRAAWLPRREISQHLIAPINDHKNVRGLKVM